MYDAFTSFGAIFSTLLHGSFRSTVIYSTFPAQISKQIPNIAALRSNPKAHFTFDDFCVLRALLIHDFQEKCHQRLQRL